MRLRLSTPSPSAAPHAAEHKPAAPRGVFGRLLFLPGRQSLVAALTAALVISTFPPVPAHAGDILRGGATSGAGNRQARDARQSPGAEAAQAAQVRAQDRLARTTQAVTAMRQMQAAARAAAGASTVPNGLRPGGLDPLTGPNAKWTGAKPARQAGNTVTIEQTTQQALLHWKTFNVGRETTVHFDQKAGGNDSGKWIAFNKVFDPSGQPSRILGSIKADGQVYVINQNGIIFGAGSQVNARTLVASSLPINDNLVERGLLNQRATAPEFLFTTPATSSQSSQVIVERGATLTATQSGEGNGGRVMLVGPSVRNSGTISTHGGQTILAAGLQVGVDAHASSDPSLRGLDVFIGEVGTAGTARNDGLIDIPTGNLIMAGRTVEQDGVVDSLTTVTLNGRIDLAASYGGLPNSAYNPSVGSAQPAFLHTKSGTVRIGSGSVMRILPSDSKDQTTVGTALPIRSRINLEGRDIILGENSSILAPNALVQVRAGEWLPVVASSTPQGIQYSRTAPDFGFTRGSVRLGAGALLDVSGTTNAFIPLADSVLEIQLRSNEFSAMPLQRTGAQRGVPLVVDLRRSGTFAGRYWIGTPLGDATGFSNIIQRNAAQLTTVGGSVTIQSGGDFALASGSVIDVSGGYFSNEGGAVRTSRLRRGPNIIDIANATPDRLYDAVYDGTSRTTSLKWGVTRAFANPLSPLGISSQANYVTGADGGMIDVTAPRMILAGDLRGNTINGPRQIRSSPTTSELAGLSTLRLAFRSQDPSPQADPSVILPFRSLTPPEIRLASGAAGSTPGDLSFTAAAMSKAGFGNWSIDNSDGDAFLATAEDLVLPPNGSITLRSRNITVGGTVRIPAGQVTLTAFNQSPFEIAILRQTPPFEAPEVDPARGTLRIVAGASIDVSGYQIDDRIESSTRPAAIQGGRISLTGYNVLLAAGSTLDASGGVVVTPRNKASFGRGGSITIRGGQDPDYRSILGGRLELGSELRAFSATLGGSLSITAPRIRIGPNDSRGPLVLSPDFFNSGGFAEFRLTGIGAPATRDGTTDRVEKFDPAVEIAAGISLAPRALNWWLKSANARSFDNLLETTLLPVGIRKPVSLSFSAPGLARDFDDVAAALNRGDLLVRGDIVFREGSAIALEPGASLSITGRTVALYGSLTAPAGRVTVAGDATFARPALFATQPAARTTVLLGPNARIDARGALQPSPDAFGRSFGTVLDGGTVSISGNIFAAAGSAIDVSGVASALDVHPSQLEPGGINEVPATSGLTRKPYTLETVRRTFSSNAGTISLSGAQMLVTEATLSGKAGGPESLGGTLSISSGRIYLASETKLGSDINLEVSSRRTGLTDANAGIEIGSMLRAPDGTGIDGRGFFALSDFQSGGFDWLDLGYASVGTGTARGGNVLFRGDIDLSARQAIRIASGGIVRAAGNVRLAAPYIAVGQTFRQPDNPDDPAYIPFLRADVVGSGAEVVTPQTGPGRFTAVARVLDVGTSVFMGIREATLQADGGEIRGSGTVAISGQLNLRAAQVYPVSASDFTLVAYDTPSSQGRIQFTRSGTARSPLSAAGSLRVFASQIQQDGVVLAPFGSIVLGWDGTDLDPSSATVFGPTTPLNPSAVPSAKSVILGAGSVTSVAGIDHSLGTPLGIPFGANPDGRTLVDPRAVDVTTSRLREKSISIGGDSVVMSKGSLVDLRGGGELLAHRWIAGPGGPVDILGTPGGAWSQSTRYTAGSLVTYEGQTWSANVLIDPAAFGSGQGPTPGVNRYWSLVPEAYALVPSYASLVAPFAPFNTGSNSSALRGDPGPVTTLRAGELVYLDANNLLPGGSYTLLPKRYAALPGAFLVTPVTTRRGLLRTYVSPEGAQFVTGVRGNAFNPTPVSQSVRSTFELVGGDVLAARATYELTSFSPFIAAAAARLGVNAQRTPADSAALQVQGNTMLSLAGRVLSGAGESGRGSLIDVSSFANLHLGNTADAPAGFVTIDPGVLSGFGAESLLIGAVRRPTGSSLRIESRSTRVNVGTHASGLSGPEVLIAARTELSIADRAAIRATGPSISRGRSLQLDSDGAFAMASVDPTTMVRRASTGSLTTPILRVGAAAVLSGRQVVLDSSHAFLMAPSAVLSGESLRLASAQISIGLAGTPASMPGRFIADSLVVSGETLRRINDVSSLTLVAYKAPIDLYDSGILGSANMQSLNLETSHLRGYPALAATQNLRARTLSLSNPAGLDPTAAAPLSGGHLAIEAGELRFGTGTTQISGYATVSAVLSRGLVFEGVGSTSTTADVQIATPIVTTTQGARHALTTQGSLRITASPAAESSSTGLAGSLALTAASIDLDSVVRMPGGALELHSTGTGGRTRVGGRIDLSGDSRRFYDVIRFTNGGQLTVLSDGGDVEFLAGSSVSVSALAGGGNAGAIRISAPTGVFNALGQLEGFAGRGGRGGSFDIDSLSITSFDGLRDTLNTGGFNESRAFRVRTGDIVVSGDSKVRSFVLSADGFGGVGGSIEVTGRIDASGVTGGLIHIAARNNLTVSAGAVLTAAAERFSSSGKGGHIQLEAGASSNGAANTNALLDLRAGATLDLSVAEFVPGSYTTPGSSAFRGAFPGTVHLRAPRTVANNDLRIATIGATILGASAIIAEGYRVTDLTSAGGLITGWRSTATALPQAGTVQRQVYDSAAAFLSNSNHAAMLSRLLGADTQGLSQRLLITPGVEIIQNTGDLTLGLSSAQILAAAGTSATAVTSLGSATINSADWNLSDFRFGPRSTPGMLTLRAAGNLVFNNALNDGFSPIAPNAANGNSALWLAQLMDLDPLKPLNVQAWSYQLTAGSDVSAALRSSVRALGALGANSGSILVGEFYNQIPNSTATGANAAIGATGLTANSLRIAATISGQVRERGTRFEVIRTGAGSISASAGRDVQLRNPFATIYTAGARVPMSQVESLFAANDFRVPTFYRSAEPAVADGLGAVQQFYGPLYTDQAGESRRTGQWALAGGDVLLRAGADIARYVSQGSSGAFVTDTSRQMPNNWLYRRGAVSNTGTVDSVSSGLDPNLVDPFASTTWWIDYSNFFQGIGALGGGDVRLVAGRDVLNVDAVAPTNARMAGRSPAGAALEPSAERLLELGGGDILVQAGRNIDGGTYYVERGAGRLVAGGEIKTNSSRSPSFGPFTSTPTVLDSRTWLPTTLFLGKGGFNVEARQNVILGPVMNTFLLPQGTLNKAWYRSFFQTYSPDSFVNVTSVGGDVTHRLDVTLPGRNSPTPIYIAWLDSQNSYDSALQSSSSPFGKSTAHFQPWIRVRERDVSPFTTAATVAPPRMMIASFTGEVNVVGSLNLFPSSEGALEILSAGGFRGLQASGIGRPAGGSDAVAYVTSRINLSDADPTAIPGVVSPSGRSIASNFLFETFDESGSFSGTRAGASVKQALHAASILHARSVDPVRIYAMGGSIESLTLFAPKFSRVAASEDISDVAFYLQNASESSISIVTAGRDIIPSNPNSSARSQADSIALGTFIADTPQTTVLVENNRAVTTTALAGDIQIGGPGILEVLAGRNIDLGSGVNLLDGRGSGITSIGRSRNPFLPFDGADLIVLAGVSGVTTRAALGLADSILRLDEVTPAEADTTSGTSREHRAIAALESIFEEIREIGAAAAIDGSYDAGYALIESVFGATSTSAQINTRVRDIRTTSGGGILIANAGGGLEMAPEITGNPLTPPGIVTEFGGPVNILVKDDLSIGQARIFTLRGGDVTIWSSDGDIAAGSAPKTVVTAPPTRVSIDTTSADVQADLGGLATGGGIGVLAAVSGVEPGTVTLIAPQGTVDAGDAGIRSTGDITIAAAAVVNADNIAAAGTSSGVPSAPTVAAPNIGGLTSGSSATGAASAAANQVSQQARQDATTAEPPPSIITVEVLGYGGDEG